jgi:hypothetical protein
MIAARNGHVRLLPSKEAKPVVVVPSVPMRAPERAQSRVTDAGYAMNASHALVEWAGPVLEEVGSAGEAGNRRRGTRKLARAERCTPTSAVHPLNDANSAGGH